MTFSQFPYLCNIVILLPIAIATLFGIFPTDQSAFDESQGWRTLVGSIWTAILILSVIGFFYPIHFSPLLLVQIIYKFLWLMAYVVPRLKTKSYKEIPIGITTSFVLIIILYPLSIPWIYLFS